MPNPSIGGAVRQLIVDANISGITTKVYRDMAPPDIALPYVTFADELGNVPSLYGDKSVKAKRRLVQVDLWQARADEAFSRIDTLVNALDSVRPVADKHVFHTRVSDVQRMIDFDDDVIHHAITIYVYQVA